MALPAPHPMSACPSGVCESGGTCAARLPPTLQGRAIAFGRKGRPLPVGERSAAKRPGEGDSKNIDFRDASPLTLSLSPPGRGDASPICDCPVLRGRERQPPAWLPYRADCALHAGHHASSTQVSLVPPPWLELTTSDPCLSATRVSPPGTMRTRSRPVSTNGRRSTWRGATPSSTQVGQVDKASVGCAMKFFGSDLSLERNAAIVALSALGPISMP